jgi:enterochelin esterase-like enzyme
MKNRLTRKPTRLLRSMRICQLLSLLIITANLTQAHGQPREKKLKLSNSAAVSNKQDAGTVVTEKLVSKILRNTTVDLDSIRTVKIYLPPQYTVSGKAYPVVYYFHNIFWTAEKMFDDINLQALLDRAFANSVVNEFILVVADYSKSKGVCLYENSPATGRWLDFTVNELVPFIDGRFRTIRDRGSRGLAGDMMGGRGALALAMQHPEIFSSVYALNPVATATGLLPMPAYPDWHKIHKAKSFDDLKNDPISQIFVTMSQAFLPNPDRPPFYCDFLMEMEDNKPKLQTQNARKLKSDFLLDYMVDNYAENLQKLNGIAFDWSRYDPIQDHVYGSQAFTRKLENSGVEHEAEEYRGIYWIENWKDDGRFYSRLLPFFSRHLKF